MDRQAALFIVIGEAHVGLDGQVRLALQVEAILDHVGGRLHDRLGVRPFGDLLLEVDVGRAGVDLDGVVGHGGRRAHVGRQLFQLHLDLLGRGLGLLDGVGADDGDGVAILEDLGVAQDRPIPAVALVGREGDQAGDAVLALDILVGDDLEHAGHLLGFGGVDREDVGVRDLGLHQRQLQRAGGHLQAQVLAVIQRAGDLGHAVGRGYLLPQIWPSAGSLYSSSSRAISPRSTLAASMTAIHDRLVAGAAAGVVVLGEPGAHLFAGGVRVAVQQRLGRDDEARRAETALGRAVHNKRQLDRVQLVRRANALDGDDFAPSGTRFILVTQARVSLPSTMTEQAPQCPSLQETFVPVRSNCCAEHLRE